MATMIIKTVNEKGKVIDVQFLQKSTAELVKEAKEMAKVLKKKGE